MRMLNELVSNQTKISKTYILLSSGFLPSEKIYKYK